MSNTENPFPVKRPPVEPVALVSLPERPLVSIIIPSFNQGRYIKATLDSILEQDYRPIEIVCMDGGSKDETVSVLKSYSNYPELRWVSEKDRGVVHAVNKGFAEVRGDVVGIQSSDDCYLPGAISRIVDQFRTDSTVGLVYGDTVKIDHAGVTLRKDRLGPFSLENVFLFRTWIPQPSTFFRREMLVACGGWNESIPYAPDTDLWIRMAFRTRVRKLDEFLSERRIHGEQRDTQAVKISRDFVKMIDDSPDIPIASPEVQKAAKAARHLIHRRYRKDNSDWRVAYHLLAAAFACPKCIDMAAIIFYMTLPIRRPLSRLKKRILG